jgi:hypothetical protein
VNEEPPRCKEPAITAKTADGEAHGIAAGHGPEAAREAIRNAYRAHYRVEKNDPNKDPVLSGRQTRLKPLTKSGGNCPAIATILSPKPPKPITSM